MIQLSNVNFKYNNSSRGALYDISLDIHKGECVLLCGDSGCGKTTVTRLINGLIPHFYEGELTGSVRVCGMNVPEEEIYTVSRKVGSVFQNPRSQFFCLDTSSELAFGCENFGMPVEQINERVKYAQKSWNWKIFWTEIYLNCPVVKSKESHVALCQRCSRIS